VSAAPARPDHAAWDAFVASADPGSYLQLRAWAEVKRSNGWSARDVRADAPAGPVGAQVLIRPLRPMPWSIAYAPRGPVTASWDADAIASFTEAARRMLVAAGRVSHLRIDPEIEADGRLDRDGTIRAALRAQGWQPAAPVQPNMTRLIDLRTDEAGLWAGLRKKWRQYVNRARALGVRVVEADGDRLPEFHRIYRETARRAGFIIRAESAYRDIWDAYARDGLARLLFAEGSDGSPVATLLLLRCGPRVTEPYGGMTRAGGETRANYLLKWEAIRRSREAGAATYDMWGLSHPGIAQFKAGFGGRDVEYIGAWDLVLDPTGRRFVDAARRASTWVARLRHGLGPRAGLSTNTWRGTGGDPDGGAV